MLEDLLVRRRRRICIGNSLSNKCFCSIFANQGGKRNIGDAGAGLVKDARWVIRVIRVKCRLLQGERSVVAEGVLGDAVVATFPNSRRYSVVLQVLALKSELSRKCQV